MVEFLRSTDDEGNFIFTEQLYGSAESSGYEFTYHPATEETAEYYSVTTPEGHIEKFNSFGLLVSETVSEDPEQRINIQYDNKSRIVSVTDIYGGTYSYAYEDNGLVSSVIYTSANGECTRTVNYEHDRNNNLTGIQATDENNQSYACRYEYYSNGSMSKIAYGTLSDDGSVVDTVGIRYTYDESGKIKQLKELTFIDGGFVVGEGATTTYTPVNTTQVNVTKTNGNEKAYQFDIKGNLLYIYNVNTAVVQFEKSEYEIPYSYTFRTSLEDWENASVSSESRIRIGEEERVVYELAGGVNAETTLTKTFEFNGKKGGTVAISGWFNGLFTNSYTSNARLLEKTEEPDSVVNFTNDRYAQIEVYCKYNGTDQVDNQDITPDIVIPFSENTDSWQVVADQITLEDDCSEITVIVRYSKNINPASISFFEVSYCAEYEFCYTGDNLTDVYQGLRKVLSYTYEERNNDDEDVMTSMTHYNYPNQETTINYSYNVTNSSFPSRISVNGVTRHELTESSSDNIVSSFDNRIVRYISSDIKQLSPENNDVYVIENENNEFVETIGGLTYTTCIDDISYNINTGHTEEGLSVWVGGTNGINNQSAQDWYGRRKSNTVQIGRKNASNAVDILAEIYSEYAYNSDNINLDTINSIKTYTNSIATNSSSQSDGLSNNYSFAYEYGDSTVEEYNYISENSMEFRYSYEYDELNRLVRYNDNVSNPKRSYTYTYDHNGNILSESVYSYAPLGTELDISQLIECHNYRYSGEDNELVVYNGEAISYNEDENTTSYSGANLVWDGDKLSSYTYTDEAGAEKRILYAYNEDGYIASKTIQKKQASSNDLYEDTEKYQYTWAYGKVINQVYTNYEAEEPQQTVIKFVYDSFNTVQGFLVDDTGEYLYLKNLQGDVVGVVDSSGNVVVNYQYGSWGAPAITIGENAEESVSSIIELLPLAYRGCYYDNATKLYFTEKRFYNPEWGRFLNAPETESSELPSAADYSLYTFWDNHPFLYTDGAEKEAYTANSAANKVLNQTVTDDLFPCNATTGERDFNFIHNQSDSGIAQYRYGINTSDNAGCGWVATYNACLLLGNPRAPEEIINEYEKNGVLLYGLFGTHPFAIVNFFKAEGYEVEVYFGDYDNCATRNGVNILIYEQGTIDHFVAVQHNGEQFMGYNVCKGNTEAVPLGYSISPITYPDENSTIHEAKMLISITSLENIN